MTTATGDPLPLEEALLQLRLRLSQALLEKGLMSREQATEYYIENRRGAGGSNFVGD
ncbi:hypothetical protein [Pseudomonas sp. C9-3]|uniref:hypothetical protein n=1 Tax=Pseudomonas sp. C9-3 TaxID=3078264 RepID=UPI0028E38DE2|nr:hypothetical protein [Pseudomonas sp. C9-3]